MFSVNFTVENMPEIVEAYLEDRCEVLARDLLNYYGQGEIYVLVDQQLVKGKARLFPVQYYYYHQGVYSNIIGNFAGNDAHQAMIQSWCDCHFAKPDHLTMVSLTQVSANLASEFGLIPGLQINDNIHQDGIKKIISNRSLLNSH